MKLTGIITRSLQADMQVELRNIERAVAVGTRDAGRGLRTGLRRQVTSAGLGQRLANSWRDKHYSNQKLNAASLDDPEQGGRFLAIPTENAPRKGTDGRRISSEHFPEHRFRPLWLAPLTPWSTISQPLREATPHDAPIVVLGVWLLRVDMLA